MSLRDTLTAGLATANTVAVSGGLDSWILAVLLRDLGRPVRAYTLATGIAGYCELAQTQALAEALRVPLTVFEGEPLQAALPRFLAVTRTPIYNLHPVSKLLLAEALQKAGLSEVLTGDGADQVFRCEATCDLLPLTQACFAHCGVELLTPYMGCQVRSPDPDKLPVRALARELGLPAIPKRPTLVPGPSILESTIASCAALPA